MTTLKNLNVLVTGGAGFVGSHLVNELIKEKAKVVVADINFDKKSYLFTESFHKKSKIINLNICNYKKLTEIIKKYKIEFIFHLAAQALVEIAFKNPKETLENNIISTINILEIARLNKNIKGVIVASSDKAYGKLPFKTASVLTKASPPRTEAVKNIVQNKTAAVLSEDERRTAAVKYRESDPLSGDHPYETSKSATDLICTTYFKTYKTPVVVTRFGNIYGEGDLNFSRIIPGIMMSYVTDNKLLLRSNGTFVRDYLYVKDVAAGYLLLAKNIEKIKGQAFNFGSNETLSVLRLIELVEKTLNKKINYKIINTAKNEIPYQSLDWTKIKKMLKWYPKYYIRNTVSKIYKWYRSK